MLRYNNNMMLKVCVIIGLLCFIAGYCMGMMRLKENPIEREKSGYEILQEGYQRLEESNN